MPRATAWTNQPITSSNGSSFGTAGWVRLVLLLLIATFFLAALSGVRMTSATPDSAAAREITFQARVTYRYGSVPVTQVFSNPLQIGVMKAYRLALNGSQPQFAMPGGQAAFPLTVTNAGNVIDTFALDTFVDGADFGVVVYYDPSESGQLSPDKRPVTLDDSTGLPYIGPLAPEASVTLLAAVDIPPGADYGSYSLVASGASLADPEATAAITVPLHVANASPYLEIANAPDDVYEDEPYDLQLKFGNRGPERLVNPTLMFVVPPQAEFIGASAGARYDSGRHVITWELESLEANTHHVAQVQLRPQAVQQAARKPDKWFDHMAKLQQAGATLIRDTAAVRFVSRAPSDIGAQAEPALIPADGVSTSIITAQVADGLGAPIEDGTLVTFRAPKGTFRIPADGQSCDDGAQATETCVSVPTRAGAAKVELVAASFTEPKYAVVPVTITAWNPHAGAVQTTVHVYFAPGAIVGRLLDHATGFPDAGVEVRLTQLGPDNQPSGEPTVQHTDEQGYYVFPVSDGDYNMTVTRPGETGVVTTEIPRIRVTQALGAVTYAPPMVLGQLVDRDSEQGIAFAEIELFGADGDLLATAQTDASGNYSMVVGDSVAEGLQPFKTPLRGQGLVVRAHTTDGRWADTIIEDVRPGDMIYNVDLRAEPMGEVVDAITGWPVAGAAVLVLWAGPPWEDEAVALPPQLKQPQPNPVIADARGNYFVTVEPGYYRLQVEAPGYKTLHTEAFVADKGHLTLDLALTPKGTDLLSIEKRATPTYSRPGELVTFTVIINNGSDRQVDAIEVNALVPDGLSPISGHQALMPFASSKGATLSWEVGSLAPQAWTVLEYQARVGEGLEGAGLTSHATARPRDSAAFAVASAEVKVGQWSALRIEIDAPKEMDVGELAAYRIRLSNTASDVDSAQTQIEVRLPQGFHYIDDSSLIDGGAVAEPIRMGDRLIWEIGTVEPGAEYVLTYLAAAGLDSVKSDGIIMARGQGAAPGGHRFETDWETAQTEVRPGLFGTNGRIYGRLVPVADSKESDFPRLDGMAVLLDDGRQTTTDSEGLFVFDDVAPGVRSVKILETSFAPGVTVVRDDLATVPARLGGWSRFVDVRPNATAFVAYYIADMGEISTGQRVGLEPNRTEWAGAAPGEAHEASAPDHASLAIVHPAAGSVQYSRRITVVVEGTFNDTLDLAINGEQVPQEQIGEWLEDTAENIQRLTYYNVPLQAGPNVLTLSGENDQLERTLFAVGAPANIDFVTVPDVLPYLDVRDFPIELQITDAHGFPVGDGTVVALEAVGAEILDADLYPDQPGFQTMTHDGLVPLTLRVVGTPKAPVQVHLRTGNETRHAELSTHFLPAPTLVAGILDLRVPLFSGMPVGFEGSAIYAQETSRGGTLTVRYDSRRNGLAPHESPGSRTDNATGGAQVTDRTPSADPLYIRYDGEFGYLLYGDYSPAIGVTNRYTQRRGRVTGLQSVFEGGWGQLGLYAFTHRGAQHRELFPVRAVLGVFDLKHAPVQPASEEVWLVRMDANSDVELGRERLLRGKDYELDHQLGYLQVRDVFPSWLGAGERVFVEIVYATQSYAGSGASIGLQLVPFQAPDSKIPPLTFTWAAERRGTEQTDTVGLNGQLGWKKFGLSLGYDIGLHLATEAPGKLTDIHAIGTAGELRLRWDPHAAFAFEAQHHWATGLLVRPGENTPLSEETRTRGVAKLALSETSRLELERTVTQRAGSDAQYRDQMRLAQLWSDLLQTHVGLRSSGASPTPFAAERRWATAAGASWQLSPQDHLMLAQELDLSLGQAGAFSWGESLLQYGHTSSNGTATTLQLVRDQAQDSGWTLAAQSSPDSGPLLYGKYHWQEEATLAAGTTVLGLADEWDLLPGLRLGLRGETISELDDAGDRLWGLVGTLNAEYTFASDHRLGMEQRFVFGQAGEQRTFRLSASGEGVPGLRYSLAASWMAGQPAPTGGEPLSRQVEGELSYREPKADRYFGSARYVHRQYASPDVTPTRLAQRASSVWFIEGGFRPNTATTWYAHWAQKLAISPTHSSNGAANKAGDFSITLRQVGLQKQLNDRWSADFFARHLADRAGASLHGAGLEVVYALTPDLGIGLGYSSLGTDDPDLHTITDWPEGWYLRLRMKF